MRTYIEALILLFPTLLRKNKLSYHFYVIVNIKYSWKSTHAKAIKKEYRLGTKHAVWTCSLFGAKANSTLADLRAMIFSFTLNYHKKKTRFMYQEKGELLKMKGLCAWLSKQLITKHLLFLWFCGQLLPFAASGSYSVP